MDAYTLRKRYKETHPNEHFFDEDTLKYFGQAISRMNVLKDTVKITDYNGIEHECYVLSAEGKDAFLDQKKRDYYYFDIETFDHIHKAEEWDRED